MGFSENLNVRYERERRSSLAPRLLAWNLERWFPLTDTGELWVRHTPFCVQRELCLDILVCDVYWTSMWRCWWVGCWELWVKRCSLSYEIIQGMSQDAKEKGSRKVCQTKHADHKPPHWTYGCLPNSLGQIHIYITGISLIPRKWGLVFPTPAWRLCFRIINTEIFRFQQSLYQKPTFLREIKWRVGSNW